MLHSLDSVVVPPGDAGSGHSPHSHYKFPSKWNKNDPIIIHYLETIKSALSAGGRGLIRYLDYLANVIEWISCRDSFCLLEISILHALIWLLPLKVPCLRWENIFFDGLPSSKVCIMADTIRSAGPQILTRVFISQLWLSNKWNRNICSIGPWDDQGMNMMQKLHRNICINIHWPKDWVWSPDRLVGIHN